MSFLESDRFPESKCAVDNQTIAYVRNRERHGTIPIVMVHGVAVSHIYFLPTADLLSDNFDVIVPDLPGHGHSSKPPSALTVQEQARTLKRFLEVLGIPKVFIIANSYGCAITTEFAIEFPQAVDRLVLIGPAADPHCPDCFLQFCRLMQDTFFENPKMIAVGIHDVSEMGLRKAIETSVQMIDYDYRPRLPLIRAKTLVIRGQNDPLAPQKWAEEAAELIPSSRLITVEAAPHNVQFCSPQRLAEIASRFSKE